MPRLPNRAERAQILANIRAEAWRVAEREADEAEAAGDYSHDPITCSPARNLELDRLWAFERSVRAALQPGRWRGFDGPDGATIGEALDDVAAAVTALDTARGGDR